MWNHMMVGATPFSLAADGSLQLALQPVISSWMWKADGTLLFKFLGAVDVTYVNPKKTNSWEATITGYQLEGPAMGKVEVSGPAVPAEIAADVRKLAYTKITVTMA